jgi:hypothetical protein
MSGCRVYAIVSSLRVDCSEEKPMEEKRTTRELSEELGEMEERLLGLQDYL